MNSVSDNAWAMLAIVLGIVCAGGGAFMGSKELIAMGGTVAGYGAAWFQASRKANQ